MKEHPCLDYGMAELICWYQDKPELLQEVIDRAKTKKESIPSQLSNEIKCIEIINGEV